MSSKQYCDRCNAVIPEENELYVLSIVNTKGWATRGRVGVPAIRSLDLCPHCLEALKEHFNNDA